jgi:putative transposase
MKRSSFTEDQTIGILKSTRPGFPWPICAASTPTAMLLLQVESQVGDMDVNVAKRLKGLEDEKARLKRLLAYVASTVLPRSNYKCQ